jgi:catechol 2,3-dioxygenase-like lactoylglutathione lyase family enzyme
LIRERRNAARPRRRSVRSAGLSPSNEKRKAMIDHIYLPVSDLKRSSEFYKKLLEPLGIDMPYKLDQPPLRGFAINNIPGFWLKNGEVAKDLYVAFTAKSADAVRASYKAAIDAGATSNKEPSLAFLASDRGAFISGADYIIDGGTIPTT